MGRGDNDDVGGEKDETPEREAKVLTFAMNRYEVTVGRFRKFIEAYEAFRPTLKEAAGAHPLIPGSGWRAAWSSNLPASATTLANGLKCDPTFQTWTDEPGASENRPINCVSWYEAFAFCVWDYGRLPTEAEWEFAAAGGEEDRIYPWGSAAPEPELASYGCLFSGTAACEAADLPGVGQLFAGRSRWGSFDLAGGLGEWVLDAYSASWYAMTPECSDCANLGSDGSENRGVRGGVFHNVAGNLRAASRGSAKPSDRGFRVGFRCVVDPA
jgi:formylglycine-generating enzyme required for sulfatase activity